MAREEKSGARGRKRYRKTALRMWSDEKFNQLSKPQPNGQSLWEWLIDGPRTTNIPGVVLGAPLVLAAELQEGRGWDLDGFQKAFQELLDLDMVAVGKGFIWLRNALRQPENEPETPNVVRGWSKSWEDIPECPLKREIYGELKELCASLGKTFPRIFAESFEPRRQASAQAGAQARDQACIQARQQACTQARGQARAQASRYQEQEQEQEQDTPPRSLSVVQLEKGNGRPPAVKPVPLPAAASRDAPSPERNDPGAERADQAVERDEPGPGRDGSGGGGFVDEESLAGQLRAVERGFRRAWEANPKRGTWRFSWNFDRRFMELLREGRTPGELVAAWTWFVDTGPGGKPREKLSAVTPANFLQFGWDAWVAHQAEASAGGAPAAHQAEGPEDEVARLDRQLEQGRARGLSSAALDGLERALEAAREAAGSNGSGPGAAGAHVATTGARVVT